MFNFKPLYLSWKPFGFSHDFGIAMAPQRILGHHTHSLVLGAKMVQLQRRFAYRYKSKNGTKSHYKYVITIPQEIVDELMWEEGELLEPKTENGILIVEAARSDDSDKRIGSKK